MKTSEAYEYGHNLSDKHGVDLVIHGGYGKPFVRISLIHVEPELRGEGRARRALEEVCKTADESGRIVTLTPSFDFGSQKGRLLRFYRSLGFVSNNGKNKVWQTMDSMVRQPKSNVTYSEYSSLEGTTQK